VTFQKKVPHSSKSKNKKNRIRLKSKAKTLEKTDYTFFPIVGIGASAGGYEAFTQFLEAIPTNTGMAFVLVQHLDPTHESILPKLLARTTEMPVIEVADGVHLKPDHVYVMPANVCMTISKGQLCLAPRHQPIYQNRPIDTFFRSLAEDQSSQAIGIILSGTASDGSLGIKAIKAEGGITFAQNEKSAKFDSMPRNAIATGCVDFILPPEKIAEELGRLAHHPYVERLTVEKEDDEIEGVDGRDSESKENEHYAKIFFLLKNTAGVDFTHYKPTTIRRRVRRRMMLLKLETLEDYVKCLRENRKEVLELYQDILINVTSFFRDPETFEAINKKIFPKLTPPGVTSENAIRVWVPGCSTGEEAYSIAISLIEYLSEHSMEMPIQIFATDVNELALEKARKGIYMESITLDVPQPFLKRYFVKTDAGYQITKRIRDLCIFSRQNVAKDPPFAKLDLITCRNLLIYLTPILQKRALTVFHYALKPTGYLVLGSSETIGSFADLFSHEDKKYKIYSKKSIMNPLSMSFTKTEPAFFEREVKKPFVSREEEPKGFDVRKEADRILLTRYAPAGVLVNQLMDVIQFRGSTKPYLEHASGVPDLNLYKMVSAELLLELRTALNKVKKNHIPVRKEGVRFKDNGYDKKVNLEVVPIKSPVTKELFFLILFERADALEVAGKGKASSRLLSTKKQKESEGREIVLLRQELAATKDYLQSIIEDQEAANEEIKSANEEIQSSNEELQSMNEELDTAKEELQSTNEELTTLNEELQTRNWELSQLNNDLNNLLGSVNIPIVILGHDLRIRRFTNLAEKVLNLIPTDVGRPLSDIKPNIEVENLERLVTEVIENLLAKELEVHDRNGKWYSMRLRPYKTLDNKIDGVIIAFIDIDTLKRKSEELREARNYAQAAFGTLDESLLVLDQDLRIKMANRVFYENFGMTEDDIKGKQLGDLGSGKWDVSKLKAVLEDKPGKLDFTVSDPFSDKSRKKLCLSARRMVGEDNQAPFILLTIEGDTESRKP
jgi:two-component system, chemotaxis family, CheB/CheR fusion protein